MHVYTRGKDALKDMGCVSFLFSPLLMPLAPFFGNGTMNCHSSHEPSPQHYNASEDSWTFSVSLTLAAHKEMLSKEKHFHRHCPPGRKRFPREQNATRANCWFTLERPGAFHSHRHLLTSQLVRTRKPAPKFGRAGVGTL